MPRHPASLVLALGILAACAGSDEGSAEEAPVELPACSELRSDSFTLTTDEDGAVLVEVTLEEGDLGFQVTADDVAKNTLPVIALVQNPDRDQVLNWETWVGGDELLTSGILPAAPVTAFDWPIREEDGPVQPGTWLVKVLALDDFNGQPRKNEDLDITVHIKGPGDLEQGCVDLKVLYAQGVEDDAHVVQSVETAVDLMVDLYADQGITLTWTSESVDLGSVLASPGQGDPDYMDLSAASEDGQLLMVIGDYLENSDLGVLGESGGAPGSLAPTERSVVVVSWLMQAGGGGKFDEEEIVVMSETMAHELGHYLGLHHPVTFDDAGNVVYFDALADTPTCGSYRDCLNELGENLMFPYASCYYNNECEPQDQVSEDQDGVWLRYTGTL